VLNFSGRGNSETISPNITEKLFIIAADLGQANDYTAITVIDRQVTGYGVLGADGYGERMQHVRHIERVRGVEYPVIVDRLSEIYRSKALAGVPKAVVIDYTGLGRPVFDMMKQAGFHFSLNAISITGGDVEHVRESGVYTVPKRDLVSTVQIELQNDRLKFAKGLKEANNLIEELSNFQTSITATGKDTYNGRSGVHDDIVMSLAMGVWLGCKHRIYRCGDDRFM